MNKFEPAKPAEGSDRLSFPSLKLGRKPALMLLGSIVVLNILLRYPSGDHEIGLDSFFIHTLAQSVLSRGHADWILNPLSYFGWYPLSYPSSSPFFEATLSSLSGLDVETTILLSSLLLGPIGILGAFLLAREFSRDELFGIFVALLYGLAPKFLVFTIWTATSRNLFMTLLPFFVWTLLRSYRSANISNVSFLLAVSVLLATTHRLVVLVFVIVLALISAAIVHVIGRVLRTQLPAVVLSGSFRRTIPYLVLGAVGGSSLVVLLAANVLAEYSEGVLVSGSQWYVELLNLAASVGRSGGLALPLGLVGLVVTARKRNKTARDAFLAVSLIALIPTFLLREYTGFYILPFLALYGGLGLSGLLASVRRRPRRFLVSAAILMAAVVSSSVLVLGYETEQFSTLSPHTYDTAIFLNRVDPESTILANDGLTGVRVGAVGGLRVLPVGGAGTSFQSPELLVHGFYTGNDLAGNLTRVPLQELTFESDSLWVAANINAELDWVAMLQAPKGILPNDLQVRYHPSYYLEVKSLSGEFFAYNNVYASNLGVAAHQDSYCLWDNGQETLWWIRSP